MSFSFQQQEEAEARRRREIKGGPLDAIYGSGTYDEVVKVCEEIKPEPDAMTQVWSHPLEKSPPGPVHTHASHAWHGGEDAIRLEIVWGHAGGAKLNCKPEEIFWALLSTACGQRYEEDSRTYRRVVSELVPVFQARGVKRIIAEPDNNGSKERLMADAPFEDQGDGTIVWTL